MDAGNHKPPKAIALDAIVRWGPVALVLLAATAIVVATVITVYDHTSSMGFPLDDSYIYLTYAKQFGRAQPFSYFPGGGYSAGSTSVIWPMLVAPFWTLGARGHALVWVSYGLCSALMLTTLGIAFAIVRRYAESTVGALATCFALLAIAPFSFTALSGMEVSLASCLMVLLIWLLAAQPSDGPPHYSLLACLAAAALSRPEASLITIGIVAVAVIGRLRQHNWRAAAWWCCAVVPLLLWLLANKIFAGNLFPNTGVAKSHFYLPGFSWSYWFDAIDTLSRAMLRGLFSNSNSPLPWPKVFVALWLAGAVSVGWWAKRQQRYLAGFLIVATPAMFGIAIIASSGLWNFQNYRYIAPAFAVLALPLGFAVAAIERLVRSMSTQRANKLLWLFRAGVIIGVASMSYQSLPRMRASTRFFAQGVTDSNTQVVAIGEYIHQNLPNAKIMFHDAGAIAYYGDTEVFDMLGLVTNYQAGIANNGPGSRFEFLESLPPAQRPTHFAYYPGWMGNRDFYGNTIFATPIGPQFAEARMVGDGDMQIIEATWGQHVAAEQPLHIEPGQHLVDRVDIADLASEKAHQWHGAIGVRHMGDPTARWSFVAREPIVEHPGDGSGSLLPSPNAQRFDGGRTIRNGNESFELSVNAALPTTLILRTGGAPDQPFHPAPSSSTTITVFDASSGAVIGTISIPPPNNSFVELPIVVPAGVTRIKIAASASYRVLHWFALQSDL
jgi:hypothetical protein